jgi:hypothetical protein
MDDDAIKAVRLALGALNEALAKLPQLGIDAEIRDIDRQLVSQPVPGHSILIRLSRTKREIDVQL